MNTKEKLYNSIYLNNSTVHYKVITTTLSFNYFIEVATLFDEMKFSRINLDDIKKNQMDFDRS